MLELHQNAPVQLDAQFDSEAETSGVTMSPPQFKLDASTAADPPVQRTVTREVDNTRGGAKGFSSQHVKDFLTLLEAKVDDAAAYVLSVPALDSFADMDGHCSKWADVTFPAILAGNLTGNIAADFGYVVESIACFNLPSTYQGMTVGLQEVRPGTRPDVVLSQNGRDIAWLDITASNSAGHIDGKQGWYNASNCEFAGEVVYNSIGPGELAMMNANQNNKTSDVMDANALEAKLNEARALSAYRDVHWREIGQEISRFAKNEMGGGKDVQLDSQKFIRQQIVTTDIVIGMFGLTIAYQIRKDMEIIFQEFGYDFEALEQYMWANFPENMDLITRMPSILVALGLNPSTFGFSGSASVATGRAWLQENDQDMPMAVPEEDSDGDLMDMEL